MRIEKEYNVQELANEIKGAIRNCFERGSSNALINPLTAQKIIDVLETVASWENKGEKSSDIREEVLKQDCFGMYDDDNIECQCCDSESKKECMNETKETEEEECEKKKERKRTLCDDCLMRYCCNADCTNEHITKQMLGELESCFGKSYGRRYATAYKTCKYKEQCKEKTKHE